MKPIQIRKYDLFLRSDQEIHESLTDSENNDGPFYTQCYVQWHRSHTQVATTIWMVAIAVWEVKPRALFCLMQVICLKATVPE